VRFEKQEHFEHDMSPMIARSDEPLEFSNEEPLEAALTTSVQIELGKPRLPASWRAFKPCRRCPTSTRPPQPARRRRRRANPRRRP
jgi:hypothetical protein